MTDSLIASGEVRIFRLCINERIFFFYYVHSIIFNNWLYLCDDVTGNLCVMIMFIHEGDPRQVLRYCRWPTSEEIDKYHNGPLQISSSTKDNMYSYKLLNSNNEQISNIAYNASNAEHFKTCMQCSTCGQERKFEFQVMLQYFIKWYYAFSNLFMATRLCPSCCIISA